MSTPTNSVPTAGSSALRSGANDVTVAILAELATPTLYQRNGFRVLGLPADATAREISRRKQTIEKAMTHAVPIPAGSGSYFALAPELDQSAVREAMQRLSEPERRLVDELFWFWPHRQGGAGDDEALCRLREGKHREAEGIWLQQETEQSESSVSVHNLAVLYHFKALESEISELDGDTNPGSAVAESVTGQGTEKPEKTWNPDEASKLWDKCFRRWRTLADQEEGFWSRLTARVRELEDPRLTAGMARRIRTALPSALLSICGQLVLQAVQCGRKDAAVRLVETTKKSGFSENHINEGFELAVEPVRKRIKALCKGAEISAENDPVHADQACQQLLSDTKPLLEGLDCLLLAGHPTRDVAHDEVADRTLRCQVKFANKTNNWNRSVTLLEQAFALASSESVRKELQEQLEVVRKRLQTADDYCGAGYYDMPTALLQQMETARQMADRHDYDQAVQRLEDLLDGKCEVTISTAHLPLVNKALAYCLGCRAIRRVNEALSTFDAFETAVITAIRDRAGRNQIDNISFICAQAQNIPQYMHCPCMACGTIIYSRYSVVKYVFNKGKDPVPVIVCGTCVDRHRGQLQGVRDKLKTAVRQSAQDFVDASQLDPANKFVEGQNPEIRKLCSSLELSMPSPRRGKARTAVRAATTIPATTLSPIQLANARRWAGWSAVAGGLALFFGLLVWTSDVTPMFAVALAALGAIFGHSAVRRLKNSNEHSNMRLSRAGLVLSYCSLFMLVVWGTVHLGVHNTERGSNVTQATQPISMESDPHSGIQHSAANAPDSTKQEVAIRDSHVTTPRSLMDAARKADIAGVRSLLAAGADPNEVDNSNIKGWTPLMEAVKVGSVDVAEALLKARANVNAANGFGATPLDLAITNHGESSPVAFLVRAAGGKRGAVAKALVVSKNSTRLTQAARDEQVAAHLARAKALWSSGNAKEALDECDVALKLDRANAEASALREKYAKALDILNGTNQ